MITRKQEVVMAIAKPGTPSTVVLLAKIGLIVYVLMFFWAVSFMFPTVELVALCFLLYSIAGIICSAGLFRRAKWGWGIAIVMWTIEGTAFCWIAYNMLLYLPIPQWIFIVVLIAVFRFASTAYLAEKKTRKSFNIQK